MREVIGRNVERTRVQRTSENAAAEIKELNSRLLKELAQKERLASLGQASAEFVHDLGNPLTIVWGYVQLLAKKLEQSEKAAPPKMRPRSRSSTSSNKMCGSAANCSPCGKATAASKLRPRKPISVSEIVREVVKGVGPMAAKTASSCSRDVCEDACTLLGDAVQIKRAIQNVMINALQASAEKKGAVTDRLHRAKIFTSTSAWRIPAPESTRRR